MLISETWAAHTINAETFLIFQLQTAIKILQDHPAARLTLWKDRGYIPASAVRRVQQVASVEPGRRLECGNVTDEKLNPTTRLAAVSG